MDGMNGEAEGDEKMNELRSLITADLCCVQDLLMEAVVRDERVEGGELRQESGLDSGSAVGDEANGDGWERGLQIFWWNCSAAD